MDQDEVQKSPTEIMMDFFGEEGDGPTSLEDFPEEAREAVNGLIWIGHLEDTFEFCGHEFTIRTLHGDEELLAGLVAKEFVDTAGEGRAFIWAQIGLALLTVDGDPDFCPPATNNKRDWAKARFQYCTRNWFWPVAAYIHSRYVALLEKQADAIQRVEDLYNGNPPMSMPFAGSSTESGDSEEQQEPEEDIREYLDTDTTDSNTD